MSTATATQATPLSHLAENLIGSEIIKIGGQLNARIAAGERIANLTIGDFDPKVFPLPEAYVNELVRETTESGQENTYNDRTQNGPKAFCNITYSSSRPNAA